MRFSFLAKRKLGRKILLFFTSCFNVHAELKCEKLFLCANRRIKSYGRLPSGVRDRANRRICLVNAPNEAVRGSGIFTGKPFLHSILPRSLSYSLVQVIFISGDVHFGEFACLNNTSTG